MMSCSLRESSASGVVCSTVCSVRKPIVTLLALKTFTQYTYSHEILHSLIHCTFLHSLIAEAAKNVSPGVIIVGEGCQ